MASIITATTTSGLTQSADNSGVLQLASGTGNLVTVPSVTGTAMVSGNMPAFSAYLNGNQSITSGVLTKVTLNTEVFDTANCFDSTTNYRFTPNVAGYYQINAGILINAATIFGTSSVINIFKNGAVYKQIQFTLSTAYSTSVNDVIYMNGSTDYLELYGQINGGSGVRFDGSSNQVTWFSGALVRAA